METIILASASPRRKELLTTLGIPFTVKPSDADETIDETMEPGKIVTELAARKVKKVLSGFLAETAPWILGADTIVTLDGKIYGKPENRTDAKRIINILQGREHQVWSGLALYNMHNKTISSLSVVSTVNFAIMTETEIDWYLDSGEWQGAAGAYQIQGRISCFVSHINGSFSSIMGLPLRELYGILKDNCYPFG